jgi:serine/threonine-protein kinase HipA
VYDLNPTPADVRPRILTTNISLDEATCDMNLALSTAGFFNLDIEEARAIARSVAVVTSTWREVATGAGASAKEINRMASAFEHPDLQLALSN